MEMTSLELQDGCTAWMRDYGLIDRQEQELVVDLANAIVHGFKLIGVPAFLLEMEEINRTKSKTTMYFKMGRTTPEGACVLGMMMPKTLFETTARQNYHAINHNNSELDYDGQLKVSITLSGIWNSTKKCDDQNEVAEIALILASGYYYEKILRHYPEWSTDYIDAPIMVTQPVDHL